MAVVTGDADGNVLSGTSDNDTLYGLGGDDILAGIDGNDTLDGGDGIDTADYSGALSGVTVDLGLAGFAQNTGGAGTDTLFSIENLIGSVHTDYLAGDGNANSIRDVSTGGYDRLLGNGGNDNLYVRRIGSFGGGSAELNGGIGADALTFDGGSRYNDNVTLDGGSGNDVIVSIGSGYTVINAGEGADDITIDTLGGTYDITLGGGRDVVRLAAADGELRIANAITIRDFAYGRNGDQVDLSAWLQTAALTGYEWPQNPWRSGHLRLAQSGSDTVLWASDGSGGIYRLITFQNRQADQFVSDNFPDIPIGLPTFQGGGSSTGGAFDDYYDNSAASGGEDTFVGNGGDDFINAHAWNDIVFGDYVNGPGGDDGDDELTGGAGSDILIGGGGDDYLRGFGLAADSDIMIGGIATDVLRAAYPGAYTFTLDLETDGGNDRIQGQTDNDTAYLVFARAEAIRIDYSEPTTFARTIIYSGGVDTGGWISGIKRLHIYLGSGDDYVVGGSEDHLFGRDGDDTLIGQGGIDELDGGSGNDILIGGYNSGVFSNGGTDTLRGGDGHDFLAGLHMNGGAGDDILVNSVVHGVARDGDGYSFSLLTDANGVVPFANVGTIDGGDGIDTFYVSFGTSSGSYAINISDPSVVSTLGGSSTVVNVERLHYRGGSGVDVVTGWQLDDVMRGGAGNDRLTGNGGNDLLVGGAGNDILAGGDGIDTADYADATAGVAVALLSQGVAQNTGGSGSDTLSGIENLAGSAFNDTLGGDHGVNALIDTLGGNDTLNGNGGADVLTVIRTGTGAATTVTLNGGADGDTLRFEGGTRYSDTATLSGGDGDDVITIVGLGTGTVLGGAGNDHITIDTLGGRHTVTLGTGVDTVKLAGTNGASRAGNVVTITDFTAGAGGDVLDLTDWLNGGALAHLGYVPGNDPFTNPYALRLDQNGSDLLLQINPGPVPSGWFTLITFRNVQASAFSIADNIRGVPLTLTGGGGTDQLNGGGGNDRLDGGLGADLLAGGAGNDIYLVDDIGDAVIELDGEGIDTIEASISFSLAGLPFVEQLRLTGSANLNATGNAAANLLQGNGGNNILDGGAGADRMEGGAGNDRYIVDDAGDVAVEESSAALKSGATALAEGGIDMVYTTVSFTLGAGIEHMRLRGSAAINGTGNALANAIQGNSNANVLDGGAGADELRGEKGDDIYFVDNAGDVVIEFDGGGSDIVNSSVTFSLAGQYVEVLTLTGNAAINGTGNGLGNRIVGNAQANLLYGLAGNDRLDGGAGADRMVGGIGNDVFVVDDAGDVVIENDGEGIDAVEARISYSLAGQYIESLKLMGAANLNGTGNGQINELIGNAGNNVLNGQGGADTMRGGAGDDRYIVDNAGDRVFEAYGEGYDVVESSVAFTLGGQYAEELRLTGSANINGTGNSLGNVILGNSGNNLLRGEGGADVLKGGLGMDTLLGGAGQDQFWFETALGATNIDTIGDFNVADDSIYLDRTVFAGISVDGVLAAGAFRIGAAALDADDRILYDAATGNLWYDRDGAGGAAAVQFAKLSTGLALTAADFVAIP